MKNFFRSSIGGELNPIGISSWIILILLSCGSIPCKISLFFLAFFAISE
jgi:hypothetical protein